MEGQVFESQPLKTLWFHWHLQAAESDWQQALACGHVRLDESPQTSRDADRMLVPGQRYGFFKPGHDEAPVDTDWKLLWQNHELMAVHKPARLPVSRTTRNVHHTLISLVRRYTQYTDAHLLHRLDAETSGLMLLAKNSHCDRKWKKRLHKLLVSKRYRAWVWGQPGWQEQTASCYLAEHPESPIRSRVFCVTDEQIQQQGDWIKPKLSQTYFRVLASSSHQGRPVSLLECELLTGRRHQIRTQLAALGHPIVGDKIYSFGGFFYLRRLKQDLVEADYAQLGAAHQLLHASDLVLNVYGERIEIANSEWPEDWIS